MKPQAIAVTMQDITDRSVADNVSQSGDTMQTTNEDAVIDTSDGEGITDQQIEDQIPTPPKEKRKQHKPMSSAAEQKASIAAIQDKLKEFAKAAAAPVQAVATSQSPPAQAVKPVIKSESPPAVKKRKLSDNEPPTEKLSSKATPAPELPPVAMPTKLATPSPEQKTRSRRRSSVVSRSSEPEDKFCPNKVKELMQKFNNLGVGFEKAVSDISARASKLIAGEDAEQIRSKVLEMEREWRVVNREHMQKMVQFMERNGVIAMGGVEVPSTSLGSSGADTVGGSGGVE